MTARINGKLPSDRPSPFRTPEHYFDTLEERIMNAIEHDAQVEDSSVGMIVPFNGPRKRITKYLCAVAAAAVIAIVAGTSTHLFSGDNLSITAEQAFSALSESDQESIIDSYSYLTYLDDESLFN